MKPKPDYTKTEAYGCGTGFKEGCEGKWKPFDPAKDLPQLPYVVRFKNLPDSISAVNEKSFEKFCLSIHGQLEYYELPK